MCFQLHRKSTFQFLILPIRSMSLVRFIFIEPLFDQSLLSHQFKQVEMGDGRLVDGVWASLNYLNWKKHYFES